MPIVVLSLLIQIALVIHIVKTGRNKTWIWLVMILPVAGAVAYVVLELLPDFAGTRSGRKTLRTVQDLVNPDRDLKSAAQDYEIAKTTENAQRLAQELLLKEQYTEAALLYKNCLKGLHEFDPLFMYGLAQAEFGLGNFSAVKELLDQLIAKNPDYKNPDAHLLYARVLESLDDTQAALHEFEVLDSYYPGAEASYHFAKLLQKLGQTERALKVFEAILAKAKTSGSYYNEIHGKWIKLTALELRR
ncbi:MAG: tetratricopeptide repeat protein [Cellvibrio sp.]|uniref:tetratricopeptide repeat protein n=1 Tax=Cellvibrio sp. TaxID=1965322 RepID=UPI0031A97CC8